TEERARHRAGSVIVETRRHVRDIKKYGVLDSNVSAALFRLERLQLDLRWVPTVAELLRQLDRFLPVARLRANAALALRLAVVEQNALRTVAAPPVLAFIPVRAIDGVTYDHFRRPQDIGRHSENPPETGYPIIQN